MYPNLPRMSETYHESPVSVSKFSHWSIRDSSLKFAAARNSCEKFWEFRGKKQKWTHCKQYFASSVFTFPVGTIPATHLVPVLSQPSEQLGTVLSTVRQRSEEHQPAQCSRRQRWLICAVAAAASFKLLLTTSAPCAPFPSPPCPLHPYLYMSVSVLVTCSARLRPRVCVRLSEAPRTCGRARFWTGPSRHLLLGP